MNPMKAKKPAGAYIVVDQGKDKNTKEILEKFFLEKGSPDLLLITQDSVGIETVREIKSFLSSKPTKEEGKSVVITNGEGLTIEAQNGMLKMLEELSLNQLVVICCSQKNLLLPTIISRCRIVNSKSKDKNLKTFEKLIKLSRKERLLFIDKEIDSKEMTKKELLSFLKQLIKEAHLKIVHNPENADEISLKIKKIKKALRLARANVNSQSTIDWLMISL